MIQAELQRLADINIDSTTRTFSSPIVYRPLEFITAKKTVAAIISKMLEQTSKYSGKSNQNADVWFKDLSPKFCMAEITEP